MSASAGVAWLEYSELTATHEPGTDAAVLTDGYACYTALRSVCESDTTDTKGLDKIAPTFLEGC